MEHSKPERQPEYLQEDSPSSPWLLRPDAGLLFIPAGQLTAAALTGVAKSPRSRRLQHTAMQRERREAAEAVVEKRLQVKQRTMMKSIEGARKSQAEALRHSKPAAPSSPRLVVFETPYRQGESVADGARAFLQRPAANAAAGTTAAARAVDARLAQAREDRDSSHSSHSGRELAASLGRGLRRHHPPGSPRSSKGAQSPRAGTSAGSGGEGKKKPGGGWGKLRAVGKLMGALAVGSAASRSRAGGAAGALARAEREGGGGSEDEERPLDRLYVLRSGAVAADFVRRLHARYLSKCITLPYEDGGAHTLALIVRLQRWVRHKRLQKTFWTMLRRRRIVVKALTRYALRFQARYKHRCAEVVLDFFQTCFQEAGFRMAMKIFLFRVVRTQRVIRTFLCCNRARKLALQRRVVQLHASGAWAEDPVTHRELTAAWLAAHAPHCLYELVRTYRLPYTKVRTVYRRSLMAGDLTSAFRELAPESVQEFLKQANVTAPQPPQYADGVLVCPTFRMLTHPQLRPQLDALLDRHQKHAARHARQQAREEEQRRQQAEFEDAVRRGEAHLYQLAQLKARQEIEAQQDTPTDRRNEVRASLQAYDKTCRRLERETVHVRAQQEKEERAHSLHLEALYEQRDKKKK